MGEAEPTDERTRLEKLEDFLAARRADHRPFTSQEAINATGLSAGYIHRITQREKLDPWFMREDQGWHYDKPIEAIPGLGLAEEFIDRAAPVTQRISERIRPRGAME